MSGDVRWEAGERRDLAVRAESMPCDCAVPRRSLLKAGAAGAAGAAGLLGGLAAEGLSTRLAFAEAAPGSDIGSGDSPADRGDVLVVLSLRGGFDGLSAVVPHGDPDYYQARPTIGVPKDLLLGGDAMFGLHPALAPLLPLWRRGDLAAVHGVGQPNPSRSHFAAMAELERAAAGTSIRTGWLDRMLGVRGATRPVAGVSVGAPTAPRSLLGPAPDLGLRSIDGFALAGDGNGRPMAATLRALYDEAPDVLAGPARAAGDALATMGALRTDGSAPGGGAVYPGDAAGWCAARRGPAGQGRRGADGGRG